MRSHINLFKEFLLNKWRRKLENGRRCVVCDIDIHKVYYAKPLRSKTHKKFEKRIEINKLEWFLKKGQVPIEIEIKKLYNPKPSRQLEKISKPMIKS